MMPVAFLSDEQAARCGRYHADPSPEQLACFFYLSPQDIRFLARYHRSYTQLGCAVQLCALWFLGTFLSVPTQIPAIVVQTLAQQLHLPTDTWNGQYIRPNTLHDHQVRIVASLGCVAFEGRQAFRLTRWLYAQVLTSTMRPSILFDLATAHLVVNALVLWNTRYLQQALEQWQETEEGLNPDDVARLSPLLHEHVNMLGRYDFTLPEAIAAG